jgi:hypothetical protein
MALQIRDAAERSLGSPQHTLRDLRHPRMLAAQSAMSEFGDV